MHTAMETIYHVLSRQFRNNVSQDCKIQFRKIKLLNLYKVDLDQKLFIKNSFLCNPNIFMESSQSQLPANFALLKDS